MSIYINGYEADPALMTGDDVIPFVELAGQRDTWTTVTKFSALLDTLPMSGGTANGVLYLNGSKVVTSGSALTFDGTDMGVGGAVESGMKLKVYGAVKVQSAQPIYYMNSDNTNNVQIANVGATGASNGQLAFTLGGVGEGMRLTSTGLGIGTSSPGVKLDVVGTIKVTAATQSQVWNGTTGTYTTWQYNGTSLGDAGSGNQVISGGGTGDFAISSRSGNLVLGTGSNARATLDASGNLGLGVTPSAWAAGATAFQFDSYSALFESVVGRTTLSFNARESASGSYSYLQAEYATMYQQVSGVHSWYIAPSGTAGNAISFTQAMTLDASGNLLVGTTSTVGSVSDRLQVDAPSAARAGVFRNPSASADTIAAWNSDTSGDNKFVQFYTEAGATVRGLIDYNRAVGLVRYNTTSDYRAKDIIGPITNSGEVIDSLKVYEGVMKGATRSRPMLIAHEAQAHAPYAVSGVKDEMNEDGTPKFQQMDVSSLVPLLLAEIQSLRARVAALEA